LLQRSPRIYSWPSSTHAFTLGLDIKIPKRTFTRSFSAR